MASSQVSRLACAGRHSTKKATPKKNGPTSSPSARLPPADPSWTSRVNRCDRRGRLRIHRLLAEHGADLRRCRNCAGSLPQTVPGCWPNSCTIRAGFTFRVWPGDRSNRRLERARGRPGAACEGDCGLRGLSGRRGDKRYSRDDCQGNGGLAVATRHAFLHTGDFTLERA